VSADDVQAQSVDGVEPVADRPELDVVAALLTDRCRVAHVVAAVRLNDVAVVVNQGPIPIDVRVELRLDDITELRQVTERAPCGRTPTWSSHSGPRNVRASPRNEERGEPQHGDFAGQAAFSQVTTAPEQIPAYRPTRHRYRSDHEKRGQVVASVPGPHAEDFVHRRHLPVGVARLGMPRLRTAHAGEIASASLSDGGRIATRRSC
jgi:hypothetical protein